jgi:hypothetical protein
MSKVLRTAAIVVGAVALVATGVGIAAGAGLFGTGLTSAVVSSVASTVATYATVAATALSIGATLTQKAGAPSLGGYATKFKADPQAPIPYVVGRTLVGGYIVHRVSFNNLASDVPNFQSFVAVLSGAGPIDAIESFSVDGSAVTFSSGNATGYFAGYMQQTTQLGASPESAALRVVPAGAYPPGWSASHKLSGMAAALWTLKYDPKGKIFPQGVPQPGWVIRGVKAYDPRLDSTYPGGSGSCRALVESTYVYTENPYLHALTYALGRYQNGVRVVGIGMPVSGLDVPAFVEGANVADANGWKVGGQITTADDKWGVMKALLQAGAGEPIHLGAQISCLISTPRTVLDTITIDDVVGEATVAATQSRRSRINAVVPRYRSEANNWEIISASPVRVTSYESVDGGQRTREITYSLVQQLTQAVQLARYDIENGREFGPITLPCKPRWLGYKPGDCVAVSLPEVGLNSQAIVIRNRSIDTGSGVVTLIGNSETNAKHAFALGQTGTAPSTPGVTAPPLAMQPVTGDWSISATSLTIGNSVTPALVVTGSTGSSTTEGVIIEYRTWVSGQAADANWIQAGSGGPDLTRSEIRAVLPLTQYEVAVSYRVGVFPGPRRIYGPVTTPNVGVPWNGVDGSGRPADGATLGENMLTNPDLAFADARGWQIGGSGGFVGTRVAGTTGDPAPGFIRIGTASGGQSFRSDPYLVGGSTRLFLSWQSRKSAGATATFCNVNLYFYDRAGSLLTTAGVNVTPAGSAVWGENSYQFNVPANAYTYRIQTDLSNASGNFDFTSWRCSPVQRGADATSVNWSAGVVSGGSIQQAGGTPVAIGAQPIDLSVTDGQVLTWALARTPGYNFDISNLPALASGESYSVRLEGLTSTGATVRLKKRTTGGTPATLTSGAGSVITTGAEYQANKGDSRDARDGVYVFRVQGQFDRMYTANNGGAGGGGGDNVREP